MENSDFDPNKILDCIFDIETSEILAEMEKESKHCNALSEQFDLSPQELNEKLSYLIIHGFVNQSGQNNDITYSVNSNKLAEIMESNHDYKNVENGLAKMDSFLN